MGISVESMEWLLLHKLEFGNAGFLRREENWSTWRKTLGAGTRTNNKLNPHMMPRSGIEPGPQWWEASALTTAPSLLPHMFRLFSRLLPKTMFMEPTRPKAKKLGTQPVKC